MATLATLDALTLNHLQRSTTDDAAMTTIIDAALNRWRREVWRRSGGLLEAPVTSNLVAGTASYDVSTLNVNAVSILTSTGANPAFLEVRQFSDIIEEYTNYPGDGTTGARGTPAVYWVKPGITADKTTVNLHPIPDTSVTNGLTVYGGAALADLSGSTTSTLPEIFDTTATWFAAVEMLSGFLHQEDPSGELLKKCASQAMDGLEACRQFMQGSDGSDWDIVLSTGDHFGPHYGHRTGYEQEGY